MGLLWCAYSVDLLIRETVSVISGPLLLPSYLGVLVEVALVTLAAALLMLAVNGRAIISVLVTSFVAFGYVVFLSETWYEPGANTWFAIAVVALFVLTVLHAALVWAGLSTDKRNRGPKRVQEAP